MEQNESLTSSGKASRSDTWVEMKSLLDVVSAWIKCPPAPTIAREYEVIAKGAGGMEIEQQCTSSFSKEKLIRSILNFEIQIEYIVSSSVSSNGSFESIGKKKRKRMYLVSSDFGPMYR